MDVVLEHQFDARKFTEMCRRESYEKVDKKGRCEMILDAWGEAMTARQIRDKILPYADMNAVRPRITELCNDGLLVETGKMRDSITGRQVTMWRKKYV